MLITERRLQSVNASSIPWRLPQNWRQRSSGLRRSRYSVTWFSRALPLTWFFLRNYRAVRTELFTPPVLCWASYRVLDRYWKQLFNYRVVQNKRMPCFSFQFVVQQQFEISRNNASSASEMLTKQKAVTCKIYTLDDSSTIDRNINWHIYYFFNFKWVIK